MTAAGQRVGVITLADVIDVAHCCITASCITHKRRIWTGGDQSGWVHTDLWPCAVIGHNSEAARARQRGGSS